MSISSETVYSMIGGCGLLGSCGVGYVCSNTVSLMYEPIIAFTGQYKNSDDFVVPFRNVLANVLGSKIPGSVEHFYVNMALIDKVVHISERAGLKSALFVGTIESTIAFFRSWQSKEGRPWVVDIMEGGLRGSLVGCAASTALSQDKDCRGAQLITGTVVGFVSGMLASFAGSVSGYVVKRLLS